MLHAYTPCWLKWWKIPWDGRHIGVAYSSAAIWCKHNKGTGNSRLPSQYKHFTTGITTPIRRHLRIKPDPSLLWNKMFKYIKILSNQDEVQGSPSIWNNTNTVMYHLECNHLRGFTYIINTVGKRSVHVIFSRHLVIKASKRDHLLRKVNCPLDLVLQSVIRTIQPYL